MRSMWKGTVSFGLVSIPIHLYAATESKSLGFRQVHAADGGRVQYKRFCSTDGQEVPYAEIAKGYELDDGSMVILTDQDLAQVPVSTSQAIDVLEFLPVEAIDPIAYDRSYYLEPQKPAVKPYVLLRDALGKSGRVALVKVTLRQRESLALLRVHADVLVLTTLLWPDEVRTPDFAFLAEQPQLRDQELAMAGSLIESMAEDVFDPNAYQDGYRQALRELIDAKNAGRETTTPGASQEDQAEVVDLMSALQASISGAQARETHHATAEQGTQSKGTRSKGTRSKRGTTTTGASRQGTGRTKAGGSKAGGTTAGAKAGEKRSGKSPTSETSRGDGTTAGTAKGADGGQSTDGDQSTGGGRPTGNRKTATSRPKSA